MIYYLGYRTIYPSLYTNLIKNIKMHIKDVHINLHFIKEIINGGTPSLLRQGLAAVSTLLLNHYAGKFGGAAGIAGMSIVTRVMLMMI